jgi:ankyrin repeat protein
LQSYSPKIHNQKKDIGNSFGAKISSTKKVILSITVLCVISAMLFSNNIKAQIDSIITEDGDGIAGITSLMNAATNNDVNAINFFSRAGSSQINSQNIGGATALHIAARNGNEEIVSILIKNGAKVNYVDNEGWTPLMRAFLLPNAELIKTLLVSGADARKMNILGETAIIQAATSNCVECVKTLFFGYDFVHNLDIKTLRQQVNEAINIAHNKNNPEIKSFLEQYLSQVVNKAEINKPIINSVSYNLNNIETIKEDNRSSFITTPNAKSNYNEIIITRSPQNLNVTRNAGVNKGFVKIRSLVEKPNKRIVYKFMVQKDQNWNEPTNEFAIKPIFKPVNEYAGKSINKTLEPKILEKEPVIEMNVIQISLDEESPLSSGNLPQNNLPTKKSPENSKFLRSEPSKVKKYVFAGKTKPFVPFRKDKMKKKQVFQDESKAENSLEKPESDNNSTANNPSMKYNFTGQEKPYIKKTF